MSPMYVVAKWLEIGMISPASVKKVRAAPHALKKSLLPLQVRQKGICPRARQKRYIAPPHPLKKSQPSPCKPVKAPLRRFPDSIY